MTCNVLPHSYSRHWARVDVLHRVVSLALLHKYRVEAQLHQLLQEGITVNSTNESVKLRCSYCHESQLLPSAHMGRMGQSTAVNRSVRSESATRVEEVRLPHERNTANVCTLLSVLHA